MPNMMDIPGWLTASEGLTLAHLADGLTVLEIGSYLGRSTVFLAQDAQHVHAVDWFRGDACVDQFYDEYPEQLRPDGDLLTGFLHNLEEFGVRDRVTVHVGNTRDVLPTLPERFFDMVFLDGAHDRASVERDLTLALRCLKPGGILALHDWDRASVRNAAHAVAGWEGQTTVDTLRIGIYQGVGTARPQPSPPQEYPMIDRDRLQAQIAGLESQQRDALSAYHQCEGALRLCRHWLAEAENEERIAAAEAAIGAETNGVEIP